MIDIATMNDRKLDAIVLKLAEVCPRLCELDHWEVDNWNYNKQIIISRDGKDVKWMVKAPPTTCVGESVHLCAC